MDDRSVLESYEPMSDLLRELDHRTTDRIDVWLLWRERDDRVIVAVADERTGARFRIELCDGERALDVFHHPYAYAAWRGIDTRSQSRDPTRWAA
jgi:hypothetical protein